MLTSQKINVHHVPDINGGKSILQSNFMSMFTSLGYLVRHLLIDTCKKLVFCKNTREYTQGRNEVKLNEAIVKNIAVVFF